MFTEISEKMKSRMHELEIIDEHDRKDGTERLKRLRQIPAETGKFLALFASNIKGEGEWIEIGTSAGYSTMWLSLAANVNNKKIKTFEILEEKIKLARETFEISGIKDNVELIFGDFLQNYESIGRISFCFLDCEKHLYNDCFNIVADKLISGGVLIADNAINHYESLKEMIKKVEEDDRFDCLTVPIGKGEFVCRKK